MTAAAGTPDTLRRGGPTLIYGSTGHWHSIMSDGRLHHFTLCVFMIICHYFPFSLFSFPVLFFGGNGQEVEEEQVSAQEAA